ncbi:MAG TPA: M48 family metallopeptidase [Candidatus Blautia pullicola]|jgi:predicted metal-dependent hydrolase|uniref:M48 family metallopeptidase n=1 Tax=Candidatus Blautia pullicola TaxID=2838498 RepID=A0A9D2FST0_9FIRM|nr:M48 family metallopeptidase [Candidatus Blautia pullicola]
MKNRRVKKTCFLELKGQQIQIEKKQIKNMYLRVGSEGEIRISAPLSVSDKRVEEFVLEKWNWIEKAREKQKTKRETEAPGWEKGLSPGQQEARKEECRKIMLARLPRIIQKWERLTGLHALEWKLRDMKTRWGTCVPAKKRIWLNLRLALYPEECLEYVVVHELVHFLVPGHGPEFWKYMDRFFPEWPRVRKELNGI